MPVDSHNPPKTGSTLPSVPRSKGCITCVARKTRCDGHRPACKACEDRKQKCKGYRRSDFVFLNEGWRPPGVAAHPISRKQARGGPASAEEPATPPQQQLQRATALAADEKTSLVPAGPQSGRPPALGPPSRGLGNDTMAVYTAFFLSQFSISSDPLLTHLRRIFSVLLDYGPTLDDDRTARSPLPYAAAALAEGLFGKLHRDCRIIQENFLTYGKALRCLSRALSRLQQSEPPSLMEGEWLDTALACSILTLWEFGMNPTSPGWKNHARGLSQVVAARQPHWVPSRDAIELISRSRIITNLEALSSNTSDWQGAQSRYETAKQEGGVANSAFPPSMILGPPDRLHFIVNALQETAAIRTRYQHLLMTLPATEVGPDHLVESLPSPEFCHHLLQVHFSASATLRRLEVVLAHWQQGITTVPRAEWIRWGFPPTVPSSLFKVGDSGNRFSSPTTSHHVVGGTAGAYLFPSLGEHHQLSIGRAVAMTLHLILCHLLRRVLRFPADTVGLVFFHLPSRRPAAAAAAAAVAGEGENPARAAAERSLAAHRAALVGHVEAVVRSVPFASQAHVLAMAPMCLVPSFRVAEVALARELDVLRRGDDTESRLPACEAMRDILKNHIEWISHQKIAIRVDFDATWPG